MPNKMPHVEREAIRYVSALFAVHSEMLHRLAKRQTITLPELGSLAEDTGNLYLNIADAISHLTALRSKKVECQPLCGQKILPRSAGDKRQP